MRFDWLAPFDTPTLNLDVPVLGYVVAAFYLVLLVLVLVRQVPGLTGLTARQWILFAACLIVAPVLTRVFIVSFASYWFNNEVLVLIWLLPVATTALWLGTAPAALVGLFAGLASALLGSGRITQPFEVALLGSLAGFLLSQRYEGRIAHWLRQPLVGMLIGGTISIWPLELLGRFSTVDIPAISSLERTASAGIPLLLTTSASTLIAGGALQAIVAIWPKLHPEKGATLEKAPWRSRLNLRLAYLFVPASIFVISLLFSVVAITTYRVATGLVIEQMARDASVSAVQIPSFINTGHDLIAEFAGQETPLRLDDPTLPDYLEHELQRQPFFEQIVIVDQTFTLVAVVPDTVGLPSGLYDEELELVNTILHDRGEGSSVVFKPDGISVSMSFAGIIPGPGLDEVAGVVIGRTTPISNSELDTTVAVLSSMAASREGFIVGPENRVILHPDQPEYQQQVFSLSQASEIPDNGAGFAYRQYELDGTRQLVYWQPAAGDTGWTVVLTVPNEVVLSLALQISLPTLLILVVLAAGILPLSMLLLNRITEPVEQLANASDMMAEGRLDQAIEVRGEDEIGRLGLSFELMRSRLMERLGEQERLLNVSRRVSSTLELFRAMPPILNSALDITGAVGVRVALRRDDSDTLQTYSAGDAAPYMAPLDPYLVDLVEQRGTIVISQLWRASGALDTTHIDPRLKALAAYPLRSETSFHGVLWLGYAEEHDFKQSEMTFLSTLAGQAAVAVANTRLFTAVEDERRKLEAVLTSTADGMIVVSKDGQIMLLNPAAEEYLDVRAEQAVGSRADKVIKSPLLAKLMTDFQEPVATLEIPYQPGKTLLAKTSSIVGHDGSVGGRVAVLRDITPLKELDNIKTVFLRMVSHDLRSPLTYMRGYASMLPLSGALNERQMEALDKIYNGVEHISRMTERLTYLSRLQFGEEAELDLLLVDIEDIIREETTRHAELANQKNITLEVDTSEKLPLILADGMLFGHAITNLVQNALKYTPEDGKVTVRAFMEDSKHIAVSVTDNGIGIRKEDQERLFEAFYRVPQYEDDPPRPTGSGLGLALVKAVAESHGGHVRVSSKFNKGSTFTIALPIRTIDDI
nr:HAMP domain-containing protein [Anaerolineae bacterium]